MTIRRTPRIPRARKSLKDTKRDNALALNLYSPVALPIPEGSVKRGPRVKRPDDEPLEHAEQAAVISWWYWYCKPLGLHPNLLVATPNAQALIKFASNEYAFMSYLKAEGLRVGMLDLTLYVPRGRYHGMIIELKRRTKGVVSPDQAAMKELLITQGYHAVIARGADDAIMQIKRYLRG